jgi:hypothetical protein
VKQSFDDEYDDKAMIDELFQLLKLLIDTKYLKGIQ